LDFYFSYLQNMDKLKAMAIFAEIADQGSMSAAARSLGVVNSVVSKNLGELENWLGRKLVFRSTRNLRLTQDGVTYVEQCRKILDEVAWLEASTREQDQAVSGHLKLTAPTYLGEQILAPVLASFSRAHPNVTVELNLSDDFKDMVDEGFDVAFRVSQMPDSGFISRRMSKVSLQTVASPEYLKGTDIPLTPKDLKEHQCILEKSHTRQQLWRFNSRRKAQSNVQVSGTISASSGQMVKALCTQGLGIAQLPDFMIGDELSRGDFVELLPQYALDNFFIHLLYHQNATSNIALKAIVEHLVSSLAEAG
jgi:LysR family transcriptional regulator for bpeEF and oprC